jgi:hypothetical protein
MIYKTNTHVTTTLLRQICYYDFKDSLIRGAEAYVYSGQVRNCSDSFGSSKENGNKFQKMVHVGNGTRTHDTALQTEEARPKNTE